MSIYVLRSDNLVKIGFSERLRSRLSSIVSSSPVPVEFVGHMPGDRSLEAHLHKQFSEHHFSGEWFVETEDMRVAFEAILTPRLPDLPKRKQRDRDAQREEQSAYAAMIRVMAKSEWPHLTVAERVEKLAEELGWRVSRAKDVYYGAARMAVRGAEQRRLDWWMQSKERVLTND